MCELPQAALYQAALQGIVLLQNRNQTLPLSQRATKLAVLGAVLPALVLGYWGNTMRGAVRNKET